MLDVVEHDEISGDLTKNFGRHNSVFGRLDRKPINGKETYHMPNQTL